MKNVFFALSTIIMMLVLIGFVSLAQDVTSGIQVVAESDLSQFAELIPVDWLTPSGVEPRYELQFAITTTDIEECEYTITGSSNETTLFTKVRKQQDIEVTLIDLTVDRQIVQEMFPGAEPDLCPQTTDSPFAILGELPDETVISPWLSAILPSPNVVRFHQFGVGGSDIAAFSPDGRYIAVEGDECVDNGVEIRSVETGEIVRQLRNTEGCLIRVIQFSNDGRKILVGDVEGDIYIFDTQTANQAQHFTAYPDSWIDTASFSPSGQYIVTSNGEEILFWDAESGEHLFSSISVRTNGEILFRADETSIIVPADTDRELQIWNIRTGTKIDSLDISDAIASNRIQSIGLHIDGNTVVTAATQGYVNVFDLQAHTALYRLIGHSDFVYSATFSPDGQYIATAGEDKTMRIWDTTSREEILRLPLEKLAGIVRFNPKGKTIYAGISGMGMIWDIRDIQPQIPVDSESQEAIIIPELEIADLLTEPKDDGAYAVGIDIMPGEWESTPAEPNDRCFWVTTDIDGDILNMYAGDGGIKISLTEDVAGIEFGGCGTFLYIGEIE